MAWVRLSNDAHFNAALFESLIPDSTDPTYLVAKTTSDDSVRLGPMADAATALTKLTAIVTGAATAVVDVP